MKQLACISFTVVLVFLVYIHRILNDMIPDYNNSNRTRPHPPKPYYVKTNSYNSQPPQCKNLLTSLLQGRWRLKDDITFKDFISYRRIDMQMRLRKGWPPLLYHGDLRCGTKYPLPRVMHTNKTEGYYLDIPSQCDQLSDSPCCRDDVGWCGNGETFCQCETCLDYRKYIPAELAVWEIANGCVLNKIDANEACYDLNRYFTSVTFIGDSLVRHLFSSLLILLTRDKEHGALRTDLTQLDKEICAGENQFVDSACHKKLAMTWNDVQKHKGYCSSMANHTKPRLSFVEAYNIKQLHLATLELKQRLIEEKPLVIIGIGVHDNFNYTRVIAEYLIPMVEMRASAGRNKGTFMWLNTHSSGPLKPNEFRKLQGNHAIKVFNHELEEFCNKNSIILIDTFNFTQGIHSFDGTHYGYEVNRLKTQILLNGLKEMVANH